MTVDLAQRRERQQGRHDREVIDVHDPDRACGAGADAARDRRRGPLLVSEISMVTIATPSCTATRAGSEGEVEVTVFTAKVAMRRMDRRRQVPQSLACAIGVGLRPVKVRERDSENDRLRRARPAPRCRGKPRRSLIALAQKQRFNLAHRIPADMPL